MAMYAINYDGLRKRDTYNEIIDYLQFHQEKIATALLNHTHLLQNAIDKIEGGLAMVKEKYAEERMFRMKDK